MQRNCARCGKPYEAKRSDSKYCGSTCRSAQSLYPVAPVEPVSVSLPPSRLYDRVERELRAAGRLETAKGQMALDLAASWSSRDPAAARAALMRELRSTLDDALEGAKVADDPMDELKARRELKLGG